MTTAPTSDAKTGSSSVEEHDAPHPPGRPVRLVPTPPGFAQVTLGLCVTLLAPMFGILIGSAIGANATGERMEPLFWGFFLGAMIGGIALVIAAAGGLKMWRHTRALEVAAENDSGGTHAGSGEEA